MSTYVPIQAITPSSNVADVEFTSIPQTFTDLVIVYNGTSTGNTQVYLTFNGSATGYSNTTIYGTGTGTGVSTRRTSNSRIQDMLAFTTRSTGIINVHNYSNTTTNKTVLAKSGVAENEIDVIAGLWANTAAITSIKLTCGTSSWSSGTTFTLYGIGSGAPKAFGGDRVVTDGTYWYHAFTSSGIFQPTQSLSCDVLVVAGGGAAGYTGFGGAGGAGGILYGTSRSLNSQKYTVSIGAGGAGNPAVAGWGANGNNSTFSTLIANGGGGGGGNASGQLNGRNGGSGGAAASSNNPVGGTATQTNVDGAIGYGNNGGNGADNSVVGACGGGGGAGAAGTNGTIVSNVAYGGNGGNGLNTWSSWATATGTGANSGYYGGGGAGGGGGPGGTAGSAGLGGGGASGQNATSNTGGGAGGGNGSSGGSGIIILRYLV